MSVPTENPLTLLPRHTPRVRSWTATSRTILRGRARTRKRTRRVLIVGTSAAAVRLARDLRADCAARKQPLLPVGFVGTDESSSAVVEGLPVLGHRENLLQLVALRRVDLVLAADSANWAYLSNCSLPSGVRAAHAPFFCEASWRKVPSYLLEATWVELERGFRLLNRPIDGAFKRFFDFVIASLLIAFLLPLMLLVALAVFLDDPGPVFYSQKRTGRDCVPFRVHKFRSMRTDAEKFGAQWATEDDPRITRVGKILRLTRLDELPQFWNVLCGQMSLIGPRPERPEFDAQLAEEIPHYHLRYRVRPGISGWAQVCYRYGASVDDARQKLAYDLYYIKNGSALLDTIILLRTVQVVLLGKGR